MARFLFWSDLHLEFDDFDIPAPSAVDGGIDAILIAGDTHVRGRHVDFMAKVWDLWRVPVLAVNGNHEPYGAKRYDKHAAQEADALAAYRAKGCDIEVLRQGSRIIGDTRILGCTLWTDQKINPGVAAIQKLLEDQMNDYGAIKWKDSARGIYRRMIAQDTLDMHRSDKYWLWGELAKPHDGPTVVMTHHVPVREVMQEKHLMEAVVAAYASDLWREIEQFQISAWIFGHSHGAGEIRLDGVQGPISFINNIRGYKEQWAELGFDPIRVLDSQAPRLLAEVDEPSPSP